MLSKV